MTTEEKAKAYEMALEAAREELKQDLHESGVWAIKRIFPELRESEDERMFNRVIESLVCYRGKVMSEGDESLAKLVDKEIQWMLKYKESLHVSESCKENADSFTDKDERIRKALILHLQSFYSNEVVAPGISKEMAIAWLEKQKEPHIPWYDYQKSKEAGYTIVPNEEYEQLIKQKEQKTVEWSKEDEKIIDTIVSVLGQYIDYKTVSGTGSGYATPRYGKEISWLKSLRPSWKPSEEQMEALKNVIRITSSGKNNDLLRTLFIDLEKLV